MQKLIRKSKVGEEEKKFKKAGRNWGKRQAKANGTFVSQYAKQSHHWGENGARTGNWKVTKE